MIERTESAIHLILALALTGLAAALALRRRDRSSAMLSLFFGSYALGDLYWLLYLLFYDSTPRIFYVSDLSWYAAYLYLYLLLQCLSTPGERRARYPAVLLAPAFAVGMCAFYMHWGDYVGNVIAAVLMSLLMAHALRGLIYLRTHPEERSRRALYIVTLAFCLCEYGDWTASCFWMGDTWANPYFWSDLLMAASLACFLPAYRRAVGA